MQNEKINKKQNKEGIFHRIFKYIDKELKEKSEASKCSSCDGKKGGKSCF